jgi:peptide/nickel transport system substrate-binding protein
MQNQSNDRELTRRQMLERGAALGVASIALPALLAACGSGADEAGTTGATGTNAATTTAGAGTYGGSLRAGFVGGGPAETLDPHNSLSFIDAARAKNLFDKLTDYNTDLSMQYMLAESMEPNTDATVWQIKLRDGVTFHDGKPLTAKDVMWSIQRNLDPDQALQGAVDLAPVDVSKTKVVNDLELELHLLQPIADVPTMFAARTLSIIQDGATAEQLATNPIGTGPFKHRAFTAGERAEMDANKDYWLKGRPYVDELVFVSIPDNTARLNALLGGQLDCIENLEFAQAKARENSGEIQIIRAPGSNMVPITMDATRKPFDDPRVRQAMRLIADREKLLETAFFGFGQLGNDVYGKGLPFYNDTLPQRTADPEQALALLKAAGAADETFVLTTSQAAPGMLESATLFAEQARAIGVKVELDKTPADTFYTNKYMQVPFCQTQWGTQSIESQIAQGLLTNSPYNETGWKSTSFDERFAKARGTLDEASRQEQYFALQQELYDDGGYLIWGFNDWVDAASPQLQGIQASPIFALGWYNFKEFWLG